MRNILTITGRELKSYFVSPLAYIIIAVFAAVLGLIFAGIIVFFSDRNASLNNVFPWVGILMIFMAPALTMKLLAEEQNKGTMELLLTAPVRDWEIVIGKYISGLVLYIAMLAPLLWQVAILARYTNPGTPDFGALASGLLGALLLGMMFLAISLLASALANNQVVAYILGLFALFMLFLFQIFSGVAAGTGLSSVLNYLSYTSHYQEFLNGVIDSNHVLYFVGIAIIALFLTTRVVESRRWR